MSFPGCRGGSLRVVEASGCSGPRVKSRKRRERSTSRFLSARHERIRSAAWRLLIEESPVGYADQLGPYSETSMHPYLERKGCQLLCFQLLDDTGTSETPNLLAMSDHTGC